MYHQNDEGEFQEFLEASFVFITTPEQRKIINEQKEKQQRDSFETCIINELLETQLIEQNDFKAQQYNDEQQQYFTPTTQQNNEESQQQFVAEITQNSNRKINDQQKNEDIEFEHDEQEQNISQQNEEQNGLEKAEVEQENEEEEEEKAEIKSLQQDNSIIRIRFTESLIIEQIKISTLDNINSLEYSIFSKQNNNEQAEQNIQIDQQETENSEFQISYDGQEQQPQQQPQSQPQPQQQQQSQPQSQPQIQIGSDMTLVEQTIQNLKNNYQLNDLQSQKYEDQSIKTIPNLNQLEKERNYDFIIIMICRQCNKKLEAEHVFYGQYSYVENMIEISLSCIKCRIQNGKYMIQFMSNHKTQNKLTSQMYHNCNGCIISQNQLTRFCTKCKIAFCDQCKGHRLHMVKDFQMRQILDQLDEIKNK